MFISRVLTYQFLCLVLGRSRQNLLAVNKTDKINDEQRAKVNVGDVEFLEELPQDMDFFMAFDCTVKPYVHYIWRVTDLY